MVFEQSVIFESYNIQAGMDYTGVPTKMMTINSTVKIVFYNRGTFFGVHVISTPLDLAFYDLKVASGYVSTFFMHTLLSFFIYFFSYVPCLLFLCGPSVVPVSVNFIGGEKCEQSQSGKRVTQLLFVFLSKKVMGSRGL